MSIPAEIAIWGLTAIVAATLAGILASIRNRDHSFWIASAFLMPPLLLVLIFLPALKERPSQRPDDAEDEAD